MLSLDLLHRARSDLPSEFCLNFESVLAEAMPKATAEVQTYVCDTGVPCEDRKNRGTIALNLLAKCKIYLVNGRQRWHDDTLALQDALVKLSRDSWGASLIEALSEAKFADDISQILPVAEAISNRVQEFLG